MQTIYKIERITEKDNNDKLDGRYPMRIGRRCSPVLYGVGYIADLVYQPLDTDDYHGMLRTSKVESIEHTDTHMIITTMNSVYYLVRLEENDV